ncbi:hypothetical protein EF847_11320 [Actinobacteria bacterium YIM 96077]|uniref:Gram-positive cocci surface proteins LPxTG domain-containing protein n=1 Tax=Phytoactinopolyspora halophila TaxID=1981511 RepID=A0A329QZ57_9ACTN|nr:helix-hairpin-helix domain-containing protein [Phytoactinopolyspora halophila]AYY13200.1 hypothetical protein EF847_11320 [Actinobacteria bacterium YIM 96077]RAW17561.1 hypothetical protein DPM12_06100 [Phytoactinopolyspora halophila]
MLRKIMMAVPMALALAVGGTTAAGASTSEIEPSVDVACEDGTPTIGVDDLHDAERWHIVTVGGDDAGTTILSDEDGTTSVSVEPGQYELAWWVDEQLPYETLSIDVPACDEDEDEQDEDEEQEQEEQCVDVNTAGLEELQLLKHIGPDRAAQILDLRPFTSIADLDRVDGLRAGGERLQELVAGGNGFLPLCPFDDDADDEKEEDDDTGGEALPDTGAPALLALVGLGVTGIGGGLAMLRRRFI